ncbi:MAG TPA: bifunctional class I SAM-dependent methyltransferase/glycosyltransferase family 2 protein [Stellaceae bacterium]|nr:bifunctional class I SAM-dependent methyltransferase/glycosyltransferase family 2 protein [Stellaceae bacterium]
MALATLAPRVQIAPARREQIWRHSQRMARSRERWIARTAFFHDEDLRYLRFLIPENSRVLELGCGTGHLLAALKPSLGVGVDFSEAMIDEARKRHPDANLSFLLGDIEDPDLVRSLRGPFDAILIVDTLGSLEDCQAMLERLHALCGRRTRLIVVHFSHLWHPLLKLAEMLRLRMPQLPQNVLSPDDVAAIVALADFEPVKSEKRLLSPVRALGFGRLINRFVAPLPVLGSLCLRHYSVFRSAYGSEPITSASVIVPARNERGNIEDAVRRIPRFADDLEIIFVEGHSRDGTWDEILRVGGKYPQYDIKALRQPGKGKADAVFAGFDAARGDVLMVLDADLTMPPEQLPKFWHVLRSGRGEFVNGSRLVYPMEDGAMRYLNLIANRIFSILFTWLLGERLTDTLCGTKALRRSDYLRLKRDRAYFGDFDPFGDFDLIFGAVKLNLKIVEVPIRYSSRTYGETQISRFRHGAMLLRMLWFAFRRIKAL